MQLSGQYLHRKDLLFHFHFTDGTTRVTQAPVVIWEGKHTKPRSEWVSSDDLIYPDDDSDGEDFQADGRSSHFHVNVTVSNKG